MDDLLKMEGDLVRNLETYTDVLIQKAKTIRWGIHQMKEMLGRTKTFWNSAYITYSLIRHLQSDWLMWQKYLEKPVGLEQLAYINTTKEILPQKHDFGDAADAIRRMQRTYGMLSKDIANGLLNGVQYNSSLASIDCLAMAQHLLGQFRWSAAEQWILAGIRAQDRIGFKTDMQMLTGPTKAELYRTLGEVQLEQGNEVEALEAYQAALKYSPHDEKMFQEYQRLAKKSLTEPIREEPEDVSEDIEEMRLPPCCSGRCEVPRKLKRLYCVYNHVTAPFLRISPIKTEILSINPFVVILHEMVSLKESALIRSSSEKLIVPSQTVNAVRKEFIVDNFRTSKSAWFDSNANEATLKLTERLSDATGLDMKHSEAFQVNNYGIGGSFETHYDALLLDEERFLNGYIDRMATSLFYLKDVPQGGGTYFPGLNITVFPKFGTVLFWYNLDTKGKQHIRIIHTGCPVIVGSKWVVSKWIDDKGQEFRRPCINKRSHTKYLSSIEKLII
nr:prolyl 4-hydroxylase subunit alpha-1 isoform X1 [Drosophila takahashii]